MKPLRLLAGLACLLTGIASAAQPALTIYNQNFAVVRDTVPLDLKTGENQVRFAGTTMHLEPDSVVLRDPTGRHKLQILEQNFRADPVSQELLLSLFEGKTIDFESYQTVNGQSQRQIVRGKIIRSGYVPHHSAMSRYGSTYSAGQMVFPAFPVSANTDQPIIEVNGRLQFSLPGLPLFPELGDDTILKPTLLWLIASDSAGRFDAELSYVTGGMSWEADYNVAAPEKGDTVDLIGWVTMDNQSGKSFAGAKIKLMAGDVNKIAPMQDRYGFGVGGGAGGGAFGPPVTEKSFDEYHLYTLERATTLLDRETKQVEFVRATGVKSVPLYVYDGAVLQEDWRPRDVRTEPEYGTRCQKKIWVMREFTNSAANHLGLPLPKGRVRFYRRNTDGQMEFTGENTIDHTPRDEVIRLNVGNAFDLVGDRVRTDFKVYPSSGVIPSVPAAVPLIDPATGQIVGFSGSSTSATNWPWIDESFEITLRNHKREAVEIRVVEHLYRWTNWEIRNNSDPYTKTDSQTIEFRIPLKPDEERKVSYTAHYWWSWW